MKKIIKAQLYDLRHSTLLFIIFLGVVIMQFGMFMGEYNCQDNFTVSKYIAEYGKNISIVSLIFALTWTGYVCGMDFTDKTANYEIMSGHTRFDIYCGRTLVSIFGGTIGTAVIMLMPMFISEIFFPWGDSMDKQGVIIRYLVTLFPIVRMICEFVFLTYIIKNPYIIMAIAWFVFVAGEVIMQLLENAGSAFLGITSIGKLYEFTEWSTYSLAGKDSISIYNSAIPTGDVISIIISSVLFSIFFWFMGYRYFSKDDLR
ncbi:MAG: hypothetical protein ACI4EF_03720 [Coprococcus sp.]